MLLQLIIDKVREYDITTFYEKNISKQINQN